MIDNTVRTESELLEIFADNSMGRITAQNIRDFVVSANVGIEGGQGPQGSQGAAGAQGVQGVKGTQGVVGSQGTQGLTGAGAQGAAGSAGAQGNQGPNVLTIGSTPTSGTAGRVLFEGAGPVIDDSSNLTFNGVTLAVGIPSDDSTVPNFSVYGSSGRSQIELLAAVDDENYSYQQVTFAFYNSAATPKTVESYGFGAEGFCNSSGVISEYDFYLYSPSANYLLITDPTDGIGLGKSANPPASNSPVYIDGDGAVTFTKTIFVGPTNFSTDNGRSDYLEAANVFTRINDGVDFGSPLFAAHEDNSLNGSIGMNAEVYSSNPSGTKSFARAGDFEIYANGPGDLALAEGFATYIESDSGTIIDAIGYHCISNVLSGGSITNGYGIKIDDQTAGTNNWAIKTGVGRVEFGDVVTAPQMAITGLGGEASKSIGINSVAVGASSFALGAYSVAAGNNCLATGQYCHAEGNECTAGKQAFSCTISGTTVTIAGIDVSAEANGANVALYELSGGSDGLTSLIASVSGSAVFADSNTVFDISTSTNQTNGNIAFTSTDTASHAEGSTCSASNTSHAEGASTLADGNNAHSEGCQTHAAATCSHAGGFASLADQWGMWARAGGTLEVQGDAQTFILTSFGKSTGSNTCVLSLDGNGALFLLDSDKVYLINVDAIGVSDAGAVISYTTTVVCTVNDSITTYNTTTSGSNSGAAPASWVAIVTVDEVGHFYVEGGAGESDGNINWLATFRGSSVTIPNPPSSSSSSSSPPP